jgi:hypothetical protein
MHHLVYREGCERYRCVEMLYCWQQQWCHLNVWHEGKSVDLSKENVADMMDVLMISVHQTVVEDVRKGWIGGDDAVLCVDGVMKAECGGSDSSMVAKKIFLKSETVHFRLSRLSKWSVSQVARWWDNIASTIHQKIKMAGLLGVLHLCLTLLLYNIQSNI